jgi:hypothetical protein
MKKEGEILNSWKGNLKINKRNNSNEYYNIVFYNIPKNSCINLISQSKNIYTRVENTNGNVAETNNINKITNFCNSISKKEGIVFSNFYEGEGAFLTSVSTSTSYSVSTSTSNSISLSHSFSLSHSLSLSNSISTSNSQSISLNNSISTSKSISLSHSVSNSIFASISNSVSISNSISSSLVYSLSVSKSISSSLTQSISLSSSLSNSISQSISASKSVSASNSTSISGSISRSSSISFSNSIRLSNSISTSNSISVSNSISSSHSISASIVNSIAKSIDKELSLNSLFGFDDGGIDGGGYTVIYKTKDGTCEFGTYELGIPKNILENLPYINKSNPKVSNVINIDNYLTDGINFNFSTCTKNADVCHSDGGYISGYVNNAFKIPSSLTTEKLSNEIYQYIMISNASSLKSAFNSIVNRVSWRCSNDNLIHRIYYDRQGRVYYEKNGVFIKYL